MRAVQLLAATLLFTSCATEEEGPPVDQETPGADLGLGDISAADSKADGEWGSALECKPLPTNIAPLPNPKITLSIDGLTLRLTDATVGFDKTYPVGPGTIETDPTQPSFMESLSYYPIYRTGRKDFEITPATIQPCKTWWTSETGERIPVFAGLPFLSFYGNYGIHGPIDNYRAPNGGTLRRGYVSHRCFRMEAADILEVYARIKGVAKVPVRLQREPEKTTQGTRVDVKKFVGSTCTQNSDCSGIAGGFCASNPYTGAGFCSARCTQFCSDRGGTTTFCVADPADATKGMCVPKVQATNFECRPYDHMKVAAATPRFNQPAVVSDVCLPGSGGWVGDLCRAVSDCGNGTTCAGATAAKAGVCTMACTSVCADMPGYADTFCAAGSSLAAGGTCLRQCTPSSNAAECPSNMRCGSLARPGSTVRKNVCLPR